MKMNSATFQGFGVAWLSVAIGVLAGCDGSVYSTTAAGDGSVMVVNRITGSVQKVQGYELVELQPSPRPVATPPLSEHHPTFADASISKQPIRIGGMAKYRAGKMLLRISIAPSNVPATKEDWIAWRAHMISAQPTTTMHITFVDAQGFEVLPYDVSLAEMQQTVNEQAELIGYDAQLQIPLSDDDFRAVSGWAVGWRRRKKAVTDNRSSAAWAPRLGTGSSRFAELTRYAVCACRQSNAG